MSPPKRTVRLLRIAEDDFNAIINFIAMDNRSAAQSLADKIEKGLAHLATHPHMGTIPHEEELAQLGYRCLTVVNYLIFYTTDSQSVLIHRIIHGARDYLKLL